MPSSLKSFEEFDRLLDVTRMELNVLCEAEPNDPALGSVQRQLQSLHEWTRGGRIPEQQEKDQLNFGVIASRELDNYSVAGSLYELASFVIYWGAAGESGN